MRKRVLSILLVAAVAVALCVPAFATGSTKEITTSGGTADVELIGTIAVTKLTVTVPVSVSFKVDPTVDATTSTAQVTQPNNITITNKSAVPVYAGVKEVKMNAGNSVTITTATLTRTVTDLNDSNPNLMFALKADGVSLADGATDVWDSADWMEVKTYGTGSDVYKLSADSKIAAATSASDFGTMDLKIHARVGYGWNRGDTFGVTPTILISASSDFNEPS